MNVGTNTTADPAPATAKPNPAYRALVAREEADTTLYLISAATVLFRHLVMDGTKVQGSIRLFDDHSAMIHAVLNVAWSRASDTVEAIEHVQEATR